MATPLNSNLSDLTSLLSLFTGKTSTTTSTGGEETKQTILSQEAVNALLKSLMEGNSGLSTVASGQKAPGLYNSSSRTLLVNDLLARSAAEVAKAGAPTVTTKGATTTKMVTPPMLDPSTGLMIGAGMLALSPETRKKISGGITNLYDLIAGGSATPGISAGLGAFGEVSAADAAAGMLTPDMLSTYAGFDTAGIDVAAMAPDLTSAWSSAFGEGALGSADIAAAMDVGAGIGGAGVIEGIGAAGLAEMGAAAAGAELAGAGITVAEGFGLAEAIGATAAYSVVCIELYRQGLASAKDISDSARHANNGGILPVVREGYHLLGIPLTRLMRKSSIVTKIVRFFMIPRTRLIQGQFNFLGLFTRVFFESICAIAGAVGRVLNLKPDYKGWQQDTPEWYLATGLKG